MLDTLPDKNEVETNTAHQELHRGFAQPARRGMSTDGGAEQVDVLRDFRGSCRAAHDLGQLGANARSRLWIEIATPHFTNRLVNAAAMNCDP
jgi:hypothetical protein